MTQVEPSSAITTVFSNLANNVVSQLASACAATDTSLTLLAGTGAAFPAAPFYCSVEYEVMWCSSKVGDVLQIQRGVDGTTAASHVINSIIQIRNNAGLFKDAYAAIQEVDAGVSSGTALPSDIAYVDKPQEFTNKTINVADTAKGNVIIGTVQPDPTSLPVPNILRNGGFDLWTHTGTTSIAAGNPTSGWRAAAPINHWGMQCRNDSSFTVTRTPNFPDPGGESTYCALLNVNTIQASDTCQLWQEITPGIDTATFSNIAGRPVSASIRVQGSSNVQVAISFQYYDASGIHSTVSNWMPISASYTTVKFENQVWFPQNTYPTSAEFVLEFKGSGQVYVDNCLVVAGSAASQFVPVFPYPTVAQPNLVINGGMEIWQRGTSFGALNGGYTADRWAMTFGGGDNMSVSKDTSNVAETSGASLHFTTSHVAGGSAIIGQSVPVSDFPSIGNVVIISARVMCDVVGGVTMNCYDSVQGFNSGAANQRSMVWETLICSGAVGPTATYIFIGFVAQSASCNVWIDNVTMVPGSTPAKYTPLTYAQDLAICQRYYEVLADADGGYLAILQATGPSIAYGPIRYTTRKAVIPTVTANNPSSFYCQFAGGGGNPCAAITIASATHTATGFSANVGSGLVGGNATMFYLANANGSMVVEANP